ncbi:MAG: glycoside hydrolase family 3 C-terminal domain-containing protein [Propioniciclava sp.]
MGVDRLTLAEKAALLSGESTWDSRGLPARGLKPMVLSDGPHGVRRQLGSGDHLGINASAEATCFPTAATVANSFDVTLAERVGAAVGSEAAALEVDVLLGPALNIKRSPLCGRNFEYLSEDPLLSGLFSAAYVRGIQSVGVAASPKHFAVNSQERRRMSSDSIIDERTLREIYLTAFEITVRDAAPRTIMSSYNKVNGTYTHENRFLLTEILRDEWGFDGLVVSDWGGSNDPVAAARAGGTLEMPSPGLDSAIALEAAVKAGDLDEADLDARVAEVLGLHAWVGERPAAAVDHDQNHALAREVAEQSAVLLKNEAGLLPLAPDATVAVIGDFARTPRYQGAGSSLVNPTRVENALDEFAAAGVAVSWEQGFRRDGVADDALAAAAVARAASSDVAVVFLGLDETRESEGKDRDTLALAENQVALLAQVAATGTPVVVVLSAGSVVEMPWIDQCEALVHAYLGGQAGASAIVRVLTGAVNPSGKLAETYPVTLADVPCHAYYPALEEQAEYREGLYVGYRYYQAAGVPVRFPFGHGLSYTTFAYSALTVDATQATFTVTNTGQRAGAEVAQVYLERRAEGLSGPSRALAGFTKIHLEPGEAREVTVRFDPTALRAWTADGWVRVGGEHAVIVGASSADERLQATLTLDGVTASDDVPQCYRTGEVAAVSDADFAALLGRPVPVPAAGRRDLDVNDPVLAMDRAKSWTGRAAASVLQRLIARSENKGKPDLNLYFLYNMPLRATAKMSGGAVTMDMADSILAIVNGHFFRGLGGTIAGFFRGRSASKAFTNRLDSAGSNSTKGL